MAGQIRTRLAKQLVDAFETQVGMTVSIDPNELHPATGACRTGGGDFYRWSGFGTAKINNVSIRIAMDSYSTMTDLVKNGITVVRDRAMSFDICAKESLTHD